MMPTWAECLVYLLAVFGATSALVIAFRDASRLRPLAFLSRKPFSCPLCLSFYVGLGISFSIHGMTLDQRIMLSSAASGFTWIATKYVTGDF